MYGLSRVRVVGLTVGCSFLLLNRVFAAGIVDGHFRAPKVLGRPEQGYVELYEYNAFLCPVGNGTGWSVRTGALPGQPITGDGWFRFENVPAGTYSLIVSNQIFWPRSGLATRLEVRDGQTTVINPEPSADYCVLFQNLNELGSNPWRWGLVIEQTFVARGRQIIRVSFKLAGHNTPTIAASIHQSNGTQIGPSRNVNASALNDLQVSWHDQEVPTTPGASYFVRLRDAASQNPRDFALIRRMDNGTGYADGFLRVDGTNYPNEDGIIYVGSDVSDPDRTISTYSSIARDTSGHEIFNRDNGDADWSTDWGQTFVARSTGLAAVELFYSSDTLPSQRFTFTLHEGGPGGFQISPAKTQHGRYLAPGTYFVCVAFTAGEVQLNPGWTYFIRARRDEGYNCRYMRYDSYANGKGYILVNNQWQEARASGNPRDLSFGIFEFAGDDPTATPTPGTTATPTPTRTRTPTATPSPTPADDQDHDGVRDSLEGWPPVAGQTHLLLADSDGDGLSDGTEDANRNGVREPWETNPRAHDTDGDGLDDGIEIVILGSDPHNAGSPGNYTDADQDGLPVPHDFLDMVPDSDNDRFLDGYEAGVFGARGPLDTSMVPPLGDLNQDAAISNVDALLVQSLFLRLSNPQDPVFGDRGFSNADPTRDGFITNIDALALQSFFLSLLPSLPVGG